MATPAHAIIDLRSDVFVPTSDAMWEAMRRAPVRWATFGEDALVDALEQRVAELLGKKAALLVPTCSTANLVALMTLAERGSQVVVGSTAHISTSEAGGVSSICGAFPRLLDDRTGYLDPAEVESLIASQVARQQPRVSVICTENSHNNAGGVAAGRETLAHIKGVAESHGAKIHLDGARLLNSAAALGVSAGDLAADADTVSISLNKGLGAPFGAVLAGPVDTLVEARGNLKRLGLGSIHRAGLYAAAGLVALDTMGRHLADDNRRASDLARSLSSIAGIKVLPADARARTNIVVLDLGGADSAARFLRRLTDRGVLGFSLSATRVRFVTHRGISDSQVQTAATAIASSIEPRSSAAKR
ncbi:MAG: aminotransferase class I/II-fold pyridoxal phosphate-dependent enzyme [Actinomycetota bacterium]|nr:aminotransferase class I/II-fold pyridoxal phosphate-dependent enzyme [Actinomycetota bacterium]